MATLFPIFGALFSGNTLGFPTEYFLGGVLAKRNTLKMFNCGVKCPRGFLQFVAPWMEAAWKTSQETSDASGEASGASEGASDASGDASDVSEGFKGV